MRFALCLHDLDRIIDLDTFHAGCLARAALGAMSPFDPRMSRQPSKTASFRMVPLLLLGQSRNTVRESCRKTPDMTKS
jgi:hypothetical protein